MLYINHGYKVYNGYIRPDAEVRGSLQLINVRGVAEGFIDRKLLMTEAEGCIFWLYTVYTWFI